MTPADLAQKQLDAYNRQDMAAFAACYADDVVVADLNGAVSTSGIAAFRDRYAKMFRENPENRAELVNRVAVGNVVIDHERVFRARSGAPFEALAIMTVANGKIARVDFVRSA